MHRVVELDGRAPLRGDHEPVLLRARADESQLDLDLSDLVDPSDRVDHDLQCLALSMIAQIGQAQLPRLTVPVLQRGHLSQIHAVRDGGHTVDVPLSEPLGEA